MYPRFFDSARTVLHHPFQYIARYPAHVMCMAALSLVHFPRPTLACVAVAADQTCQPSLPPQVDMSPSACSTSKQALVYVTIERARPPQQQASMTEVEPVQEHERLGDHQVDTLQRKLHESLRLDDSDDPSGASVNIIQCSDGVLIMRTQDLRFVFEKMPTLEYVLLGHPNMIKSSITVEHRTRKITIGEEWGIKKQPFGQVLSCALGTCASLPECQDDRALLIHYLEMLGGFDILDSLLRAEKEKEEEAEQLRRRKMSITPVADLWGMFDWRTVGPIYAHVQIPQASDLYEEGFEYVGFDKLGTAGLGMHHFRRKRS